MSVDSELRLEIVDYYARPASFNTGGVNQSRVEWATALAASGHSITVVDAVNGYQAQVPRPLTHKSLPHVGRSRPTLIPLGLAHALYGADLLILHEGWTASNFAAALIARAHSIPYVVVPHGVYDPRLVEGLRLRRVRAALEKRLIEGAAAVHVFFRAEIDHILQLATHANIIVQMTGFDSPPKPSWTGTGGYVAYLGRYDIRHKGLDVLLEAMTLIPQSTRPRLEMRGPDHRGDKERLQEMIKSLGLEESVHVGDVVQGTEKDAFLREAALTIHPSRWESFGRSIVEGMAVGSPTAVSSAANIASRLDADHAAIVFELTPMAVQRLLEDLPHGVSAAELSEAGHEWVKTSAAWATAADGFLQQLNQRRTTSPRATGPTRWRRKRRSL